MTKLPTQLAAFPALEPIHGARILCGDAVEVLRGLPARSVDTVISDVPYGLSELPTAEIQAALGAWLQGKPHVPWAKGGFMGRAWDAFVPGPELWREIVRVAKPGARVLVFGAPRTVDLIGLAMRLGGLEIVDLIGWVYGTGAVRGQDIAKAIDKSRGLHRGKAIELISENNALAGGNYSAAAKGRAASETARRWEGWNTTLKTALEPVLCGRVPLEDSPAVNVQRWGTGAWNTEAGRVRTPARIAGSSRFGAGRFPANFVHDGSAEAIQQLTSKPPRLSKKAPQHLSARGHWTVPSEGAEVIEQVVTPDRYFYCAKPTPLERQQAGGHETLKPIALMRWLVRLATPPGGVVLDCCAGSGTTNAAALEEGFDTIAIEADKERIPAMRKRLEAIVAGSKRKVFVG